jgi:DNA replication protein DnaC
LAHLLKSLSRLDLFIIDDLGLATAKSKPYRDLLEVIDDRIGRGATLLTSQYPVAQWHDLIGDATVADALLDRLVHNAYRLELDGKSLRDPKATPAD